MLCQSEHPVRCLSVIVEGALQCQEIAVPRGIAVGIVHQVDITHGLGTYQVEEAQAPIVVVFNPVLVDLTLALLSALFRLVVLSYDAGTLKKARKKSVK